MLCRACHEDASSQSDLKKMLDQFQLNFTNIIMKNVNEKFESLDLKINNMNIPNSNVNTNMQSGNSSNNNNNGNSFSQSVSYNFNRSTNNNNLVHDPVFKDVNQIKILNLMEKIAKFKNHINIFRIHLSKNTTPSTLFFNRFPKPMFYDDEQLINSYNDIILVAQTDMIKASIKSCEDKLKYYEDELLGYINSLNSNDRNIKEFYKKLEDGKLESLSEFFSKKSEIAERAISRPYTKNYLQNSNRFKNKNFNTSYIDTSRYSSTSNLSLSSNINKDFNQSTPTNNQNYSRNYSKDSNQFHKNQVNQSTPTNNQNYSRNYSNDSNQFHNNQVNQYNGVENHFNHNYNDNDYNHHSNRSNNLNGPRKSILSNQNHQNFQKVRFARPNN